MVYITDLCSMVRAGLVLASVSACTAAPLPALDPEPGPVDTLDTPHNPPAPEGEQDSDTAAPVGPLVRGRLLDPSRDPLAGLSVRLCNASACYEAPTTSEGVFALQAIPPGRYAATNPTMPGSSPAADALSWSPFFDYIDVPESGVLDWRDEPWIVPHVTERYAPPDSAGTLTFAEGALTVSVASDALVWPDGVAATSSPTIGAVEVPPAGWPRHGFGWAEHIRAFAFAPFDLQTTDPNGFEVTIDIGDPVVPEGAGLVVFVAGWPDERPFSGFDRYEAKLEGTRVTIRTPRLSWVVASVYRKDAP